MFFHLWIELISNNGYQKDTRVAISQVARTDPFWDASDKFLDSTVGIMGKGQ